MPRFTATDSSGTFTVLDTANANHLVLSMSTSDIHSDGLGTTPTLAPGAPTITEIDRAFGTPQGFQREMGFDLDFTFTNTSGSDRLIGGFGLEGFNLETPVEILSPLGDEFETIDGQHYRMYPGDLYSPLIVIRDDIEEAEHPYNICVGMCYPALDYDHLFNTRAHAASPGAVPTELRFRARVDNGIQEPTGWVTIPNGVTRRYRLCFRINDRTDTTISNPPAENPAQEWLWTLRGYQQYFRRLYRKPDYRRMGGWNGRVVSSFNGSPSFSMANPRGFDPENPTTTGGSPSGYFKFTARAETQRGRNIPRFMIWALSGQHNGAGNYDFRFATQVASLTGDAPTTVRPALRTIRNRMQLGLWWGNSATVFTSGDWDTLTTEPFDPDDPDHVAAAFAELDLAIQDWRAQLIGMDAYNLAFRNPGKSFRWLRQLQRRYPHVLFITEANLPDVLHTLAPTYVTEDDPLVPVQSPFWLQQYVNPGNECLLQINGPSTGQASRASELAEMGFTVLGSWSEEMNPGTRAVPRWRELGESAIPGFSDGFDTRPLSNSRANPL